MILGRPRGDKPKSCSYMQGTASGRSKKSGKNGRPEKFYLTLEDVESRILGDASEEIGSETRVHIIHVSVKEAWTDCPVRSEEICRGRGRDTDRQTESVKLSN